MEFSRQEYWSGVPLPSPNQETRVVAKNYLLESISKEKWFCEDLGSGSETSVKGQTVNTSDVMDHIDS